MQNIPNIKSARRLNFRKRFKITRLDNARGFTLIEVLLALLIVSICMTGIFSFLPTAVKTLSQNDIQETARNLATAQMEYVKALPYDRQSDPLNYPSEDLSTEYPEFSITVSAERIHPIGSTNTDDEGVQKIVISVFHDGVAVTTMEGYKADWQ
jgi:prepilin-type N-terminal cleavage/methylation domain-containing protein